MSDILELLHSLIVSVKITLDTRFLFHLNLKFSPCKPWHESLYKK